jgi:copper homeostasis protein
MICKKAGKTAVCHRAFDVTPDPIAALDTLIKLDVDRVLTSGQQANVIGGAKLISELIKHADGRIEILPGAGLDYSNIEDFIEKTGVEQIHISASTLRAETSTSMNPGIYFGGALYPREDVISVADINTIRNISSMLGK